jgi:cysteine-rich repeat protein
VEQDEACDDGNRTSHDGCSATCTIEQECFDAGNTFSFFVWSDSYTSSGDAGVSWLFADAVDQNKYPTRIIPRFWVSTGDIPFMVDGKDSLDRLNRLLSGGFSPFTCAASTGMFPYFVAIGNHDIDGYQGSKGTTPQSQYQYWSTAVGPHVVSTLVGLKHFRDGPHSLDGHDARTTYSFDYKNAHFVIVNQYFHDPAYPTNDPVACIRQELYDWLAADLTQTSQSVKFVFGHEPAWPYCTADDGFGGAACPPSSLDNQSPSHRPRPYSTLGPWPQGFGRHWDDSLNDVRCPNIVVGGASKPSRNAFWELLAKAGVIAHFNGHTHAYSSRFVQGDGVRRNDISAYNKTGQRFQHSDGVWEVDSGQTHNTDGSVYVLTTVRENEVTFEAYDQLGSEPFQRIESWSVVVNPGTLPNSASRQHRSPRLRNK